MIKPDSSGYSAKGSSMEDAIGDTTFMGAVSFDTHDLTEKIIKFGEALTGLPLYIYQREIAYSVIHSVIAFEGKVITVILSRQSGKSETMAFIIDTLAVLLPALAEFFPDLEQFKDGVKIGLFAPQADQVTTTYGRALQRIKSENAGMIMTDPELDVEMTSDVRIELTNGSFLKGQTASKQSKIESKTYDLVVAEEAQDIDEYLMEKSIEPMVSATGGTIVKVGTTGTMKNHYWRDIQNNRNTDRKSKDHRCLNNLEFDYKKVIKARREKFDEDGKRYHLNYENDVLRKKDRMGEDSFAFKLGYALKWDLETGMLITDEDFDAICNKRKTFHEVTNDDYVVAGLDIGKDRASTVITIARVITNELDEFGKPLKEIIQWVELAKMDYELQHHAILDAILEFNIQVLYADYTGVGKPVVDRLVFACGDMIDIIPYIFTKQSKSDMWYNFTNDITTRRIIIPANRKVRATSEFQAFEEQMKNCTKQYDGAFLVCEKSVGYLDDYVDSAALMSLAGNHEASVTYEIEDDDYNPLLGGLRSDLGRIKTSSY